MRRNLIRLALILLLIWAGLYLYGAGKMHKVLLDNKDWAQDAIAYTATTPYLVLLDGEEVGTVRVGKRKAGEVMGARHTIVLEELDEDEEPTGKKIEKSFSLKPNDAPVVNIPALVGGSETWWEMYVEEE